jgi:hypothetical protein
LKRSRAGDWVIVSGYKDDRYGNASRVEAIPQFDARTIVQVDVENDANRPFEIGVCFENLHRWKQHTVVPVPP